MSMKVDVMGALDQKGLTDEEAVARLRVHGPNALPSPEARSFLSIAFNVVHEPMMLLLLAAGLIYLVLGDPSEAIILLLLASVSVVITVVQETRTERVLEALRDLTSPRALVIRNGIRKRIAGRDLVPGDVMVLEEGARVPADGALFDANDLMADESLLTGESIPVQKAVSQDVFSGTMIVRGKGLAIVTATGLLSRIGQIGTSLNSLKEEPPRLLAETRRLVRLFGAGAAVICVMAVLLYGLFRSDWLTGVLAGIALAMSMLPEEFPVVLTVFTAMGAWRISRARVLTRRAATIESLGAATVLCTDKTGTLTENRMSVAALHLPVGEVWRPLSNPECPSVGMKQLALYGRLASDRQPYDPMELAFHELGDRLEPDPESQLVRTYGLRPDLMAMTQVWSRPGQDSLVAATKGAPEAVLKLCRVATDERTRVLANADKMAQDGLRVLAIASTFVTPAGLPETQGELPLVFVGLVGLADPLRAGVFEAISEARGAGIRVVMITGDYPVTACAIARQAGMDAQTVLTGQDLKQMDDRTLSDRVRTTSVFARITPDQKLHIVNALKANGNVVAMTGDGVNDAPSLKAAHIGIAMGKRGTDVAREASSLVLLDDDFASIIHAIRLGRRIHDNLRKAMCFIVAVHVPVAGLALLPLVFGMPVILEPIHIALLELVIDPVCSLVFENENEEADIMGRPPMSPEAPLLSLPLLAWGVVQGLVVLGLVILTLLPQSGLNTYETSAFVFFSLVLLLLSLTVANRSFKASLILAFKQPNPILAAVICLVLLILGIAFLSPWILGMLNFAPLGILQIAQAAGVAGLGLVILEALKVFWRRAFAA